SGHGPLGHLLPDREPSRAKSSLLSSSYRDVVEQRLRVVWPHGPPAQQRTLRETKCIPRRRSTAFLCHGHARTTAERRRCNRACTPDSPARDREGEDRRGSPVRAGLTKGDRRVTG